MDTEEVSCLHDSKFKIKDPNLIEMLKRLGRFTGVMLNEGDNIPTLGLMPILLQCERY